ncbi:alpha/beta fold hydrolase [Curtobacterium sp. MCBD17_030]|uniref:alpha/beta fold hydrolase n=1 Tax=Curtobacterium sp. MCBD17_030 TaxID=2175649 RepID=UPI000D880AF3|nr:alpha/beta hydrolase [Curtobacterium sp. MCBD17_030]PYY36421.1 alpha/beta hydrolase [Curtobacterium sp. MCBD17_030]
MSKKSTRSLRITAAAAVLVAGSLTAIGASGAANAQVATPAAQVKPTVVLVHGAWADGASFGSVGSRLRHDGYTVLDFATPLRSLAGDTADLDSFLKVKTIGPVILVGHSYGGEVVTQAATSDPDVKGLVYIDAFAPDQGESIASLSASVGASVPTTAFDAVPYAGAAAGDVDLYLKQDAFDATFANGFSQKEQDELFARQEPLAAGALTEKATVAPAWKTLPSWYVEGTQDKSVSPALQEKMATRAHAHITKVDAGHLSMLKYPGTVTRVIEQAATTAR